ncbi:hypothetical protein MN116_003090 [Schistosoma mekongi]|uniref:FERM domain-containing protein n=1 Tax=Schistosoma mekongi TaxID=38744 RepID=A0AAE1ZHN2_SCHME|nr:hypothetical protein MN116_003090 [Schistosoma mekongi]
MANPRALGRELYAMVVEHLQLVEYDYFDLEYVNKDGLHCWLDHSKAINRQINISKRFLYSFVVKFYTPHPNLLEDELTRYLFALQIKIDLRSGRLQCSESTAALLAAFIVQGERCQLPCFRVIMNMCICHIIYHVLDLLFTCLHFLYT